jgi:NAD+ kinase
MSAPLIGIIAHTGKPGAAELVTQVRAEFQKRSAQVQLDTKTAEMIGDKSGVEMTQLGAMSDILVVLGGDGTILQVLHDLGAAIKPIFGINLGSLGFLTCVSSSAYQQAIDSIVAQSYVLSYRTLLDISVERESDNVQLTQRLGMNDVVISRGAISRLIKLETRINHAVLTEYNADGLIIATPTGSTAYSLAAGGPILTPDCGVFVITPICPHVLTNRSVIVSDTSLVSIRSHSGDQDVFLTVDGQQLLRIRSGEVIRIRRAPVSLPLAMLPEISFFEVLRQKLKWSGSAI